MCSSDLRRVSLNQVVDVITSLVRSNNLNNDSFFSALGLPVRVDTGGAGAAVHNQGEEKDRQISADRLPPNMNMVCDKGHAGVCLNCCRGAHGAGRGIRCETGGCDSGQVYPLEIFKMKFPRKRIFGEELGDCRICYEELQ